MHDTSCDERFSRCWLEASAVIEQPTIRLLNPRVVGDLLIWNIGAACEK